MAMRDSVFLLCRLGSQHSTLPLLMATQKCARNYNNAYVITHDTVFSVYHGTFRVILQPYSFTFEHF